MYSPRWVVQVSVKSKKGEFKSEKVKKLFGWLIKKKKGKKGRKKQKKKDKKVKTMITQKTELFYNARKLQRAH